MQPLVIEKIEEERIQQKYDDGSAYTVSEAKISREVGQATEITSRKSEVTEKIYSASEKILSQETDPQEMVKQARALAKATVQLINHLKGQAESVETDSDLRARFITAAKLLADATARLVDAAKGCKSNPSEIHYHSALKRAAEVLRDETQALDVSNDATPSLVRNVLEGNSMNSILTGREEYTLQERHYSPPPPPSQQNPPPVPPPPTERELFSAPSKPFRSLHPSQPPPPPPHSDQLLTTSFSEVFDTLDIHEDFLNDQLNTPLNCISFDIIATIHYRLLPESNDLTYNAQLPELYSFLKNPDLIACHEVASSRLNVCASDHSFHESGFRYTITHSERRRACNNYYFYSYALHPHPE